jgi:RNA polymerase sigma-70 factor (ECF subfamily)
MLADGGNPMIDRRTLLERLFDAHSDEVFRFVVARSGSHAVAEDVTGEVFLAAARRIRDHGDDIDVRWLIGVARNRLIDTWRSRERDRRRLARASADPSNRDDHTDIPPSMHQDERTLRALRSLPDRQRAAVVLRYLDELSVSEVADRLDMPYGTAESLLARGRRSFKQAYEEAP